jgi:hypothetical protein
MSVWLVTVGFKPGFHSSPVFAGFVADKVELYIKLVVLITKLGHIFSLMQNCNMVIMRRIPDLCLMAKINGELVLRM